jgi:hypothetical protein
MVFKGFQRNIDNKYPMDDRINCMPDQLTRTWKIEKDPVMSEADQSALTVERKFYRKMTSFIKPLYDGGVKFLVGTDYGNEFVFPGFSLHEELHAFVEEAGLTPLQALQTATINPAIFFEMDSVLGTVEEGKIADLLLLNNNPLVNINNTESIEGVIINKLPRISLILEPIIVNESIEEGISKYRELKKGQPEAYNFGEQELNRLGYC